jgi:hypothetical protein
VVAVVLIGLGLFFSGVFGGGDKPLPAPPVADVPAAVPAPAPAPAPAPVVPEVPAITATERTLGLRWMPADTELVVHAKVADLWQAPLLKTLVEMPQTAEGVKQMQQATGLAPVDIESMSIGFANIQGFQAMAMSRMMGMPSQSALPKVVAVVRTKKPVSLDELLMTAPGIQAQEHGTKKFFKIAQGGPGGFPGGGPGGIPGGAPGGTPGEAPGTGTGTGLAPGIGPGPMPGGMAGEDCGWLADSTTLILAQVDELKMIMDRGESKTPARKELLFADASPHFVLLFAPKDFKSLTQGAPAPPLSASPNLQAMQTALTESCQGFELGITVRGGFDLQTSWLLKDAESAGKVKVGLDEGIVEGRKQFETVKMAAPPLLGELGEMLLANLKVEAQSQVVKVSTGLPDSVQQKLVEDLPPLLTVLALSSGLNLGGGNPFAEPGAGFPGVPSGPNFGTGDMPPGFGPKNPGETEPIAAEVAEGAPDGTTLTASTSWGRFPTFTADGKSAFPMQLILDLKGDALAGICAFGQVSIKTGSLAGGGALKVSKTETIGRANPVKALVPFDVTLPSPFEHPEGTMRISFEVDAPAEKETTIGTLEGTFKILTSDDAEEFTIDEAPKTAKRPLTDPGLKAAGVKLIKSSDPLGETFTLSCAKGFFLGKAQAINPADPTGMTMMFNPETEKNQIVQKLQASGPDQKFPEMTQVKFKVFKGVKEQTVTFKFAGVPLPSADSKPKMQQAGQQPAFGPQPPNAGPQPPNSGPRAPNSPMPAHSQPAPTIKPQP